MTLWWSGKLEILLIIQWVTTFRSDSLGHDWQHRLTAIVEVFQVCDNRVICRISWRANLTFLCIYCKYRCLQFGWCFSFRLQRCLIHLMHQLSIAFFIVKRISFHIALFLIAVFGIWLTNINWRSKQKIIDRSEWYESACSSWTVSFFLLRLIDPTRAAWVPKRSSKSSQLITWLNCKHDLYFYLHVYV